jgi:hypothetical protein
MDALCVKVCAECDVVRFSLAKPLQPSMKMLAVAYLLNDAIVLLSRAFAGLQLTGGTVRFSFAFAISKFWLDVKSSGYNARSSWIRFKFARANTVVRYLP